jgi:hypothetical protein
MKKLSKFLLAMLLVLGLSASASAATVTFELGVEFSGADSPEGPAPWLVATFEDFAENQVKLTLDAGVYSTSVDPYGLTGTEYVTEWYFNIDPPAGFSGISGLTFLEDSIVEGMAYLYSGQNGAYQADGDGYFNLLFKFQTAAGDGRFGAGDAISMILTGEGLEAESFLALSTPAGNSPDGLYTAAKIQGIGSDENGSGWITVPVPPAALLLGSGLLGLLAMRRRMKK